MDFREVGDGFVALDGDRALAIEGEAAAAYRAGGWTRRQLLTRIGAGAAVAGVTYVAAPMVYAHASLNNGATPTITLTPSTASRGGTVQVTGSGFATVAGSQVQTVTVDGITVTPSNTAITAGGTFNFTFTVPNGAALGGDTVQVTDNHHNTATATLTVQAAPTVTNTSPKTLPHNGAVTNVTVTGTNFVATPTVQLSDPNFVVQSVTFVNSTTLTVAIKNNYTNNGAHVSSLTVTNPDGTSSNTFANAINN